VEAQRLAVELALKRRQMKEALAIAANLQRQYPDDSFGYRLEGDIEFEQTRWDAAAAAYRKGLQKQEPEAVAQGLHAALQKGGRQIEADKAAADWLKTHPKDTSFIGYLGDTALKTQGATPWRASATSRPWLWTPTSWPPSTIWPGCW
jgi:predicted Zn-dependent protease